MEMAFFSFEKVVSKTWGGTLNTEVEEAFGNFVTFTHLILGLLFLLLVQGSQGIGVFTAVML
jgi:hypothetical protein